MTDTRPSAQSSARAPLGVLGQQIRTRQRVRDLAEVYTHEREVNAMLNLIPDMFPQNNMNGVELKFLEPACGSGNFLEEILQRKLVPIRFSKIRDMERYEHWLLRGLASIYAIDISAENVTESRDRILSALRKHYINDADGIEPTSGFVEAAEAIVITNIQLGNTLTDASILEVIDYKAGPKGTFKRTWSMLDESPHVTLQLDLFAAEPEIKQDRLPIHYSWLGRNPGPARAAANKLDLTKGA
jgi:hypothetical protein